MRVLIAGGGAVGGTIARAMAASGGQFTIMENNAEVLRALRESGLILLRGDDRWRVEEVEVCHPRQLQGSFDAVFLAVKGPHLEEAMRSISPHMHRDTFFVSLQAGWAVDALAEMVELKRVTWGTAEFAARCLRPGTIEILKPGPLVVGEPFGPPSPRLRELQEILVDSSSAVIEVTPNAVGRAWWTMRLSALLAPLSVLGGLELEDGLPQMLEEPFAALCDELEELARLEGVVLEPPPGMEERRDLAAAAEPYARSMRRDLERGERLEREFTTGFLLSRGKARSMRMPAFEALHSLLGEVEKEKLTPSPRALKELRRRMGEERELGLM